MWLYRALYFLHFGAGNMITPFLSLYYAKLGLTGTQMGIIWAAGPLLTVIFQPIWGLWSDAVGRRRIFLLLLAMSTLGSLLYLLANQFWQLLLVAVILAIFRSPIGTILDSFVLAQLEHHGGRAEYGKSRLWGAVGWSIFTAVAGRIIDAFGFAVMFILNSLGHFTSLLVGTRVKESRKQQLTQKVEYRGLVELLRNRQMSLLLLSVLLLQMAASSMYSFFSIYLDTIGAPSSMIGTAYFLEGLSEIPIFFLSSWFIRRMGAKWGIAVGALAYSVRLLAYSFIEIPVFALIFQLLHGLSFSLFFASAVNYVDTLVPAHMRTTGQALLGATYWGLGSILGNSFAGVLYDRFGVMSLFRVVGIIALVSCGLVVLFVKNIPSDQAVQEA